MKSEEAPQTRSPAGEAEGQTGEGASGPTDGAAVTASEDATTGSAGPSQSVSARRDSAAFPPEAWGEAARATCLSFLLGMALVVATRFAFGGDWVIEFLDKNQLPMDARMSFVAQSLALGSLCALVPLGLVVSRKWPSFTATVWESFAWFLSPLMLLPAVPVMMKHQVWAGKHEDLLPIVLFGALIAEVLFSKSFANIPPQVARAVSRFLEDDEPVTSRIGRIWKEHHVLILVCLIAAAYGAFMSFYTIRWHHKLGTATFDLGINNNLLYGGLEGKFNQSPVIFPEDPQKYLANHVKIGLYSFLPIYVFYPKPETLLAIQSIAMGLGAIPLFLFARRRIPEWWALALAAVYLSYYPLHGANFYEMKLVPTASAWVLTCIWAIDAKRFVTGGIFFLWATLMREDMPVPMAVVGAAFLLSGHRPRAGLIMALVASSWFVFLRFRFMNDVGNWWFPNMYEDLWAEPEKGFRSVIKTLISNPTFTLKHIFIEKKFWYLMHLLVPMAFLPVRRWWAFAAMIPGAIMTLLVTDYAPPTMFSFQYVMHWAPYMYVASALVLAQKVKDEGHAHSARAALVSMCLASLALTYNYGAFPRRDKSFESGYHKITFSFSEKERKTLEDVRRLVASIPVSASVASTERIGAHLSSRVGFYTLRRGSHGVDYIVANKAGLRLDRTKETVKKALESKEYGLVGRFGEFAVFKKGADPKGNEAIMSEWSLTSRRTTRLRKAKGSGRDSEDQAGDAMAEQLEAEIDDPGPLPNSRPRREEVEAHE